MKKFYKVLLGTESSACPGFHYNVDTETIAPHWNPAGDGPAEIGGFNIATEAAMLRWICRGNILYDVILPEDAEIVYPPNDQIQGELARVNKLILTNPRPMTDEIAMHFYKKAKFHHQEYFKILVICAICGHTKTCEAILHDHVTPVNARECLMVWDSFLTPEHCSYPYNPELYRNIRKLLCQWIVMHDSGNQPIYIN